MQRFSLARGRARGSFGSIVGLCAAAAMLRCAGPAAAASPPFATEDALARGPVSRDVVIVSVLARHPALTASRARARAAHADADAEGRLPSPEVMLELWQVPLARPYAVDQAGMLMTGLRQRFPAPGSLGARQASREALARGEDIAVEARGRDLARASGHAFADYAEAHERLATHREHHDVATKLVGVARARHAAGGRLTDLTQTEVELATVSSDLATDDEQVSATRARLNALLARPPDASLADPALQEPAVVEWSLERLLAEARLRRPETRMARAAREGADAETLAAQREATLPSFTVGLMYFAPVSTMPMHGYGASLSADLPWLWGGNARRADARALAGHAAKAEEAAASLQSDADVAAAFSTQRTSAERLRVLLKQVRPTSRRAFDAAWAGYAAGETDLLTILAARRSVIEADVAIVSARAALEHALTELEWAVGAPLPRRSLFPEVANE